MNFKLILSTCILLFPSLVYADGNNDDLTRLPTNVIFESLRTRPKDGSQSEIATNIECYYLNGYLHLHFQEPEGTAKLTITQMETSDAYSQSFSSLSDQSIHIGDTPGYYQLLLSTTIAYYLGYLTIE